MHNNRYIELIARKLSTDITKDEEQSLDNWLKSSDENQESFRIYSSIWSDLKIKRISKNSDNVFERISTAIQEEESDGQKTYQIQENTRSISYLWRGIAAAILILV
ncbi:MAG: hypothetical protein KAK04_21935, partial [Cyclobacteriaceae bacterium]|nr:hypothetical protein [Cyclobacteriaceae bacterium]